LQFKFSRDVAQYATTCGIKGSTGEQSMQVSIDVLINPVLLEGLVFELLVDTKHCLYFV
jgi:hypothetical protein